jgi:hypothetical protein
MSDAAAHIAAWEAAGLIDGTTAERLRAAEAEAGPPPEPVQVTGTPAATATRPRSAASAMFGPSVTISEVFGYLGGAFLLAAWSSFMVRAAGADGDNEIALGVMAMIAAAGLATLGLALRGRTERASRAAGVAFVLTTSYVATAAVSFSVAADIEWPIIGLVGSSTALLVAIVLRTVHPSVLTQVGVLAWLTALAGSLIAWVQDALFADALSAAGGSGPDPIFLVIGSAVWWLATAVIIALIGLREAGLGERDADPAAFRRAAVSRFWAGLTAVIGLSTAVRQSAETATFEPVRVLEPWVGALALLILSGVLVERAFRRDATSFIYAAALGLIVALTDFNVSYLSDSTEIALLIEGFILLGVGFAADRLRRRIGGATDAPPIGPLTAEPPPVASRGEPA